MRLWRWMLVLAICVGTSAASRAQSDAPTPPDATTPADVPPPPAANVAKAADAAPSASVHALPQGPRWQSREISDPDVGDYVELSLQGVYTRQPSMDTAVPILVVQCAKGKVLKNLFSFGAVLSQRVGGLHRVEIEVHDDGERRALIIDELSPDSTSAYFRRDELRRMLQSHTVTVRAVEFAGPPFYASFTMPDSAPVLAACGDDWFLKRK
jgi:hypothetical protein